METKAGRRERRWKLGEGGRVFALGVLVLAVPMMIKGLANPWGWVTHRPEHTFQDYVHAFGFAQAPRIGFLGVLAVVVIASGAALVLVLDRSHRAWRRTGALAILGGAIAAYALFATIDLESVAPWDAFPNTPRCRDPVWDASGTVLLDEGVDGDCTWLVDTDISRSDSSIFSSPWTIMAGSIVAGVLGLIALRRLDWIRNQGRAWQEAGYTEGPAYVRSPTSPSHLSDAKLATWVVISVVLGLLAFFALMLWALSQMDFV